MKAYAVQKTLYAPALDFLHFLLFHGEEVEEEPYRREVGPKLGDDLSRPVYLVRNARAIPAVFQPAPSSHLVVSEEVKAQLQTFPHVAFGPVCFQKVVDFTAYRSGDSSFEHDAEYRRVLGDGIIDDFLKKLPDVPALHGNLPPYYELVLTRLSDITPKYQSLRHVVCKLPLALSWEEKFSLSAELMTDYPIVWGGWTVFNEEAFGRISPYLDRDYFEVGEIQL